MVPWSKAITCWEMWEGNRKVNCQLSAVHIKGSIGKKSLFWIRVLVHSLERNSIPRHSFPTSNLFCYNNRTKWWALQGQWGLFLCWLAVSRSTSPYPRVKIYWDQQAIRHWGIIFPLINPCDHECSFAKTNPVNISQSSSSSFKLQLVVEFEAALCELYMLVHYGIARLHQCKGMTDLSLGCIIGA